MSKKSKPAKHKKSLSVNITQADRLFDLVGHQIFQEDYTSAVTNCERLLRFLPSHSPMRADVLGQLGTAHAMLQNFPQSYKVLSEAVELAPNNAELWYNRGLASRFTCRFGRSLRDFERAAELNTISELSKQINEEVKFSSKAVKDSLKMRGPNFTLDQLIEQEEHFQHGVELMEARQWEEAEQAFQTSIAMGDCLPQPWGNLGICFMMQERYDEAEAALKRALDIDPKYTIAKQNLAALPETRRKGPPKEFAVSEPFRGSKLKQSITFIAE